MQRILSINERERRAAARRIALLYAAAGGLWVVASDLLVAFSLRDLDAGTFVGLGKGVLFVAVTSGVIWWLVARSDAAPIGTGQVAGDEAGAWRRMRGPLLIFVALAICLLAGGIGSQLLAARRHIQEETNQIAAIGEIKAQQIESWLSTQAGIAESFRSARALREDVTRAAREKGSNPNELRGRLEAIRTGLGAQALAAVGPHGEILAASAVEAPHVSGWLEGRIEEAVRLDRPQMNLLHRDPEAEGGAAHLDYVIPLRALPEDGSVAGVLLLRQDPAQSLFKQVQFWPAASATAESFLARREGADVVALNELRYRNDSAFKFRLPVSAATYPAVRIVAGGEHAVRATDYRGEDVLAYGRQLSGTDWFLIAKADTDDVLAQVRQETATSGFLVVCATLLAAVGTMMMWSQQTRLAELRRQIVERDRSRAETALRESEAVYRSLFEHTLNGLAYCRMLYEEGRPADFVYVDVNQAFATLTGLENVAGRKVSEVIPGIRSSDPELFDLYHRVVSSGRPERVEIFVKAMQQWLSISVYRPRPGHFVAVFDVITARKRAQQELEYKNLVLAIQQESALDAILLVDEHGTILSYNHQFLELWRIPEELARAGVDAPVLESVAAQMADREAFVETVRQLYEHREQRSHDELHTRDGRIIDRHSAPVSSPDGRYYGRIWYFRDVTEPKSAEAKLRESEMRFRAVIEQSITGACIIDAQGRFAYVNPRLAMILGYASEQDVIGRPVLADFVAPESRAVVAENMRVRIVGEEQTRRYHFEALRRDGTRITLGAHGTRGTYQGKPVIVATVQDVTELQRAEREIKRSVEQLRGALRSTIGVVSMIGELRDPYTHGHERRVGEIAAAIGAEMGLDAERVEGLRVAGNLHDVGKISVPAEILAKPTRLTATEFALVKQHAQQGHEILKGVEFPWPVAEAAWQHHERLDGSGYPRGLKGDEIILEARILGVADTVEAMASHRPYRPGLGMDAALGEIEGGSGRTYDPQVAAACLRLFREKGYIIPG